MPNEIAPAQMLRMPLTYPPCHGADTSSVIPVYMFVNMFDLQTPGMTRSRLR
jgi:hypothetical protein